MLSALLFCRMKIDGSWNAMSTEQFHTKPDEAPLRISCADIFWTFFRIGLFTLGGGLAMTTVMRHELVLKRRWLADDGFMNELSTATAVPGAIAVNLAYLQGRRLHGGLGATSAVLGVVLPSFFVILLIAWFAMPYFGQPKVAVFFRGCAIGVGGQLAFTSFAFGRKLLRSWPKMAVCAGALAMTVVWEMHPIWVLVVAGGLGFALTKPGPQAPG